MYIIIIGAGEVGYNIASRLSSERNHVVVIDLNQLATQRITEDIDVQAINASGSDPNVLKTAGIDRADILLAVTDSDEINIMSCMIAHMISPGVRKLARIRNQCFDSLHEKFKSQAPYISTIINPEAEVVATIRKLMDIPGCTDAGSFANGKVKYVGIRVKNDSPIVGLRLMDFPDAFSDDKPLIAAIIRGNEVRVPTGHDKIRQNDLVYFVCEASKIQVIIKKAFGLYMQPVKNILIVGGGRIGERLALAIEKENISAKIIETDINRCRQLSEKLEKTVVLHGSGSDQKLLYEENVSKCDVAISVTDDDETNILISLLAKNLGLQNTITRIGKARYFPLLSTIGIDKVVSPRMSAVSSILQDVRKGKVLSDISIFGERGEFIEAVALETADITNGPLKKISFPKGALLVCIIREDTIIIPSGDSRIQPDDKIILFAVKQAVKKLEKLLTVKLEFI